MEETAQTKRATFGAGCFWGVEEAFCRMKGVKDTSVGYEGGHLENPTYKDICSDKTGHAEVVQIEYDPDEVSYEALLKTFWELHDPTTPNRQGADIGTQYRSIILYTTPEQKQKAEKFIADINASSEKGGAIVTEVEPLTKFYDAEDYHKDYFAKNPYQPYCQVVINPKLKKVQERFAALLNTTETK